MSAIGGSIQSVTLSGRTYPVAGDAEVTRKKGGYENELQMNGDQVSARLIKTAVPWMLGGVQVVIDDSLDDHEFLQELSDRSEPFPCAIAYVDGTVYQGSGNIVGELMHASNSATATFDISGAGTLEKQA